jgi:hypothetical protein
MTPWLLLDIVLALAAIITAALWITRPVPPAEGNRRAEADVLARRDAARKDAWRQLEARLKGQDR